MIDSNTYNEKVRTESDVAPTTFYSSTDADSSPVIRQTDNSAAESELPLEERIKCHEKAIDYMNRPETMAFYKLLRRHECNPFNALFYDKEPITEEDIRERVERASEFFDLPIPSLIEQCDTLAEITFSASSELGSEIKYDIKRLSDIGINNLDAFEAILSHELSHQFLSKQRFNFCYNHSWCVELACDFIVGVRCSANLIASGKYKYSVSIMKASASHPDGKFRLSAVKSGFEFGEWLLRKRRKPTARAAMIGITKFLCSNSIMLNEAYDAFLRAPVSKSLSTKDIMDYPDSNLIKQTILKYQVSKEADKRDETS